jgi:asparagine synthase (glutamine-hydrolysing)
MLLTDLQILQPDIFLEKVDRPTMATGTEVRVPFLDHNLADYVIGLPSRYKVRRGEKKRLLRAALRGVIPDSILDGRKVGFGVPVGAWLKGPLRSYAEDSILSSALVAAYFDPAQVRRVFSEHAAGRRDHGMLLWKLLQLALWLARINRTATGIALSGNRA